MQKPYLSQRQVEFRDTDAAGIMHFSAYFTYMEEVEHEFLRSLGTSVIMPLEASTPPQINSPDDVEHTAKGMISWPRVAAECQYCGAARFEEPLEIELRVTQLGTSSVTYGFRFRTGGREIAAGSLTSVCCKILAGHPPQPIPIPEPLRKQLATRVAP